MKRLWKRRIHWHVLYGGPVEPITMGSIPCCFSSHAVVSSVCSSKQRPRDFERMISMTFLIVGTDCLAVEFSCCCIFGDAVLDQVSLPLEQNFSAAATMKSWHAWFWHLFLSTLWPCVIGVEEITMLISGQQILLAVCFFCDQNVADSAALIVSIYVPSFNFVCALVTWFAPFRECDLSSRDTFADVWPWFGLIWEGHGLVFCDCQHCHCHPWHHSNMVGCKTEHFVIFSWVYKANKDCLMEERCTLMQFYNQVNSQTIQAVLL